MPRNNPTTNGNGNKPTSTTGEGFENYTSPNSTATQPAPFQLNADATIGQLLNASDDQYTAFITQIRNRRSILINQRAREVANYLNPQLQVEEIMVKAQQIVDIETAGAPPIGHTLPTLRGIGEAL